MFSMISITIGLCMIFFIFGVTVGKLLTEFDGFFIIDDRDPDKTKVTVDLHKDQEKIEKQKTVTFRVLKKV